MTLEFTQSAPLTMGVELELMILSTHDWNLIRGAEDLLALIENEKHAGDIKPEITESMIEISTGVNTDYLTMLAELKDDKRQLSTGRDEAPYQFMLTNKKKVDDFRERFGL